MSTSIHPHRVRAARSSPATPHGLASFGVALRSIGAALVPGRAEEDVVPALHAADAQALLARAGVLDAADRTGSWDRTTMDAVTRFQRARRLPASGIADRRTCDALLGRDGQPPQRAR